MKYCTKCLIPDTRPDQIFDKNGVCNACRSHELKEKIDWSARQKDLDGIIENIKKLKINGIVLFHQVGVRIVRTRLYGPKKG